MHVVELQNVRDRLLGNLSVRMELYGQKLLSSQHIRHPGKGIREKVIIILDPVPDLFLKPSHLLPPTRT